MQHCNVNLHYNQTNLQEILFKISWGQCSFQSFQKIFWLYHTCNIILFKKRLSRIFHFLLRFCRTACCIFFLSFFFNWMPDTLLSDLLVTTLRTSESPSSSAVNSLIKALTSTGFDLLVPLDDWHTYTHAFKHETDNHHQHKA